MACAFLCCSYRSCACIYFEIRWVQHPSGSLHFKTKSRVASGGTDLAQLFLLLHLRVHGISGQNGWKPLTSLPPFAPPPSPGTFSGLHSCPPHRHKYCPGLQTVIRSGFKGLLQGEEGEVGGQRYSRPALSNRNTIKATYTTLNLIVATSEKEKETV